MKGTIIDDTSEHELIILEENGDVKTIANTPYWKLKMQKFDGERMYHKFNDEVTVQETFTNGIFNLFWGADVINIGIEHQDDVAIAIEKDEVKHLDLLYHAHKRNIYKKEMITNIISAYGERIRILDMGFIIDDMFMVDRHGTAYKKKKIGEITTMDNFTTDPHSGKKILNLDDWAFVCIVAHAQKKSIRLPNGVDIIVSDLDDTIIAKILFLLHHETCHKDSVFMNQLDDEFREILFRNISKDCKCDQCVKYGKVSNG